MSSTMVFVVLFLALSLQAVVSLLQVRNYRRNLSDLSGNGIVGVGHTKGVIRPGQIVLLKYDREKDRVVGCKKMSGLTVLARFKTEEAYIGMTLEEVREEALRLDNQRFKRRRKKHPYDPEEITKKKDALIQAIEAIDRRIIQERRDKKEGKVEKIRVSRPKDNTNIELV